MNYRILNFYKGFKRRFVCKCDPRSLCVFFFIHFYFMVQRNEVDNNKWFANAKKKTLVVGQSSFRNCHLFSTFHCNFGPATIVWIIGSCPWYSPHCSTYTTIYFFSKKEKNVNRQIVNVHFRSVEKCMEQICKFLWYYAVVSFQLHTKLGNVLSYQNHHMTLIY